MELGTPEAIKIVADLLVNDPNSSVRIRAAKALKDTDSPIIISAFAKALTDWDSGVVLEVLNTLNAMVLSNISEIQTVLINLESAENRDNIKNQIRKLRQKYNF